MIFLLLLLLLFPHPLLLTYTQAKNQPNYIFQTQLIIIVSYSIQKFKQISPMYNPKHNTYKYNQSSQQQDSSQQDEHISPTFLKSHVFNNKQLPLVRSCDDDKVRFKGIEENDQNGEGIDKEQQEEELHLRPKLRVQSKEETKHLQTKSNKLISDNVSGISAKSHSMSQVNLNKKAVNAAYTFKLKSPNPAKKKHDPVSLFQQTANSWKKDKFLTSRTDLKQGRKLQLQKRNKQYV